MNKKKIQFTVIGV